MKEENIKVRYYNVMIDIRIGPEKRFLLPYLTKLISGKPKGLKAILEWCENQGLKTRTKFHYRKDFPIYANLCNYMTYIDVLRRYGKNKP